MRLRERGVRFQRRRTVAAIVGAVLALGSFRPAQTSLSWLRTRQVRCVLRDCSPKGSIPRELFKYHHDLGCGGASAPIRIYRVHRFQRANEPDQHRVRGRRAHFRRREEWRHQGLRQPQRHHAHQLQCPSTKRPQLLGPGLLGLALDPSLTNPSLPSRPWVYVLYTYDHILGSPTAPPRWGDTCPTPPGPTTDGCVVSGRLSRFTVSGTTISNPETVLIEDWCQQFPSHSNGNLAFGPDGALYVSAGDGASFNVADYGQLGGTSGNPPPTAQNPCADPLQEGGALRSQDLRTEPVDGGGATYADAVAQDAPIAWYRMGEPSGTNAADEIGSNDGTYVNTPTLDVTGALTGDSDDGRHVQRHRRVRNDPTWQPRHHRCRHGRGVGQVGVRGWSHRRSPGYQSIRGLRHGRREHPVRKSQVSTIVTSTAPLTTGSGTRRGD